MPSDAMWLVFVPSSDGRFLTRGVNRLLERFAEEGAEGF